MNSILMSMKPKRIVKIASGEMSVVVSKSVPKCGTPFKVYIYMTKENKVGRFDNNYEARMNAAKCLVGGLGKVVGEFVCDKVDDFECSVAPLNINKKRATIYDAFIDNGLYKVNGLKGYFEGVIFERNNQHTADTILKNEDLKNMCLSAQDLFDYISIIGKNFYGLHISDLKIYDKPKELSEFMIPCREENCKKMCYKCWGHPQFIKITRPPQSWCYVEEL